jgi:hypothetical protein
VASCNLSLRVLLLLAVLCLLAYARALDIPLIEDDYPTLFQAQQYGGTSSLGTLLSSPVLRNRATSYWSMFSLWQVFEVWAPGYHIFSLVLHVLNTWLLYGIALAWPRMRAAAPWAAAFFAVQEGHQEAVMWFTAINELWMFLFGAGALLCFELARSRPRFHAAGALLFALALISKESAVIWVCLFPLVDEGVNLRRLAPYAMLAAAAALAIFLGASSFRFSDGSFSLHAPFWITWPRGMGRVLWIWGWPAAAVILLARDFALRRAALLALLWIGVALVPYVFLTYSTQIPSRQTYLASAGLALLVGMAAERLWRQKRRWAVTLIALVLLHNCGILWTRKRAQFLERAEPTERLIALARRTSGPIWVQCFPRTDWIAKEAVRLAAGRDPETTLVWNKQDAEARGAAQTFCYRDR